jgi:hypothetical protein
MEPSNLSINSTQQSASQFFQGSVASLKSWGSRVCQQLHHHREILHTYSPKTKIGLLIAVNTVFFFVIRMFVNYLEERGNRTNPEKTGLHATISPVVFGVAIAGLNVGLSKLGRYQLPALTLYAITISSVAVYLILKRPRPLLAPIQDEISLELVQINKHTETLNRDRTELQRQASIITARLTTPPQTSTSTPALPQTPPPASIPTLPQPVTPALPQSPSREDQAELQRIQTDLAQNEQTQRSLTELAGTLQQEAAVISEVARNATPIPADPRTPERVNLLRASLRTRFERTLTQSSLVPSQSGLNLPQSAPPSTPTRSDSSPQVSGTPGTQTPPATPTQTSSTSSSDITPVPETPSTPGTQTPQTPPATPTQTSSTSSSDITLEPETSISTETVQPEIANPSNVLRSQQSLTSWLVTGAINNFGPTIMSNVASTAFNFLTR